MLDACKNYDKRGEEDGATWIDLQTGETIFLTWSKMNYISLSQVESSIIVAQMELSPDQKQLAVNEWKYCSSAVLHLFPNLHHKHQPVEEQPLSYHIGDRISDFCFHANSTNLFCFKTMGPSEWKMSDRQHYSSGWVGELIALSTTRQDELWRVTIDYRLTGLEWGISEGTYGSKGYAGKVWVGEKEVVCTAPGGQLLFFDMENGRLKRKMKVNGNYIYAIGWHRDGDKIRVATDQELQVIEWK